MVLDWCFAKGGNTYQYLTSSGLVSGITLGNELAILTHRGEISLSSEQSDILEDIQSLELTCENTGNHGGTTVFLQGQLGSGKTVIGMEIARIIKNKRLIQSHKQVVLTFEGNFTKDSSSLTPIITVLIVIQSVGMIN